MEEERNMNVSIHDASRRSKPRLSRGDRVFVWVNYALLILITIVTLYPLLFVISASISDPKAVASGKMILLPIDPTLEAYRFIFNYQEIWTGYANTIFYTFFGTLINLALTVPAAYALSRRDCPCKGFIMTLFMITMYFGGGLIPGYLNIRQLGLLNSRAVLLICGAVSTYNLIVARTFFANTIPWELHEAAFLDGCSDFGILRRIVLPLSSPIIVVLILYYGVTHWNSYFNALIYQPGKIPAAGVPAGDPDAGTVCQRPADERRQPVPGRHAGADQAGGHGQYDQVRRYYRFHRAHDGDLSVGAEVLCQGDHDRLCQGLNDHRKNRS